MAFVGFSFRQAEVGRMNRRRRPARLPGAHMVERSRRSDPDGGVRTAHRLVDKAQNVKVRGEMTA